MASSTIREVTSQATLEEKKKLRKEFNYFDMVFYTVAALIGLDTLGAFASNGAQALTWVIVGGITFFLPYGLLTAELGSTFTQEGGMYEWCKMAGGRLFAALGAMLYWVSNPLWIGGTLSVESIAAIKTFWFGSSTYLFGATIPPMPSLKSRLPSSSSGEPHGVRLCPSVSVNGSPSSGHISNSACWVYSLFSPLFTS